MFGFVLHGVDKSKNIVQVPLGAIQYTNGFSGTIVLGGIGLVQVEVVEQDHETFAIDSTQKHSSFSQWRASFSAQISKVLQQQNQLNSEREDEDILQTELDVYGRHKIGKFSAGLFVVEPKLLQAKLNSILPISMNSQVLTDLIENCCV